MSITDDSVRAADSRVRIAARTLRRDRWWLQPVLTEIGLVAFVVYSTWVTFLNADYYADPYVSPFYSPCLAAGCPVGEQPFHATFAVPAVVCPAPLVLVFPLGPGECFSLIPYVGLRRVMGKPQFVRFESKERLHDNLTSRPACCAGQG